MGLLDGSLAGTVFNAFRGVMLDGVLYPSTLSPNGKGGFTQADGAGIPVKCMVDPATKVMQEADGFKDTDVALMILCGTAGIEVHLDNEIVVTRRGVQTRYRIMPPLSLEAAFTHWTCRGRQK